MSPRVANWIGHVTRATILALALSSLSVPAHAQGPSLAGLRVGVTRLPASDTLRPRYAASGAGGKRVLLSVLGAATGAVAGVVIEREVPSRGLYPIAGWAIGSVLGAGLGAALPRGSGACAFRVRAPRALLGSSLGYLFGAGVTLPLDPMFGLLIGGPIGAVFGGAVGAGQCRGASPVTLSRRHPDTFITRNPETS